VIDNNRTGFLLPDGSGYGAYQITQNAITNNKTFGVLFNASTAIDSGFLIQNNNISGNYAVQLENNSGSIVNASGNWWGSTMPVVTASMINGTLPPAFAYPGPASPPGSPYPYDITGSSATLVDFTPYLNSATDIDLVTPGFQGDLSVLNVTAVNIQTGFTGRIQEGINLVTSGGTVNILTGSYTGDVSTAAKAVTLSPAGSGIGIVTISGNLLLDGNDALAFQFTNTANDKFLVNGIVTLGGGTLVATSTASLPPAGYTLIENDFADSVTGTFVALAQNATLLLNGVPYQINYLGGTDSNDVTLALAGSSSVVVSGTTLIIFGTNSKDQIDVKDKSGSLDIKVRSKTFDFDGAFSGITTIVVYGYGDDDHIRIQKDVTTRAFVFGGDGNDDVEGGGGNSVLVGGAGDDKLKGGAGRNILIGGTGKDKLEGMDGEDILIGGTTNYDNNVVSLDAILGLWEGGGTFTFRRLSLSGLLNTSTVFDDGDSDDLKGGKGLDWFFANTDDADKKKRDKINDYDQAMGEFLTEI